MTNLVEGLGRSRSFAIGTAILVVLLVIAVFAPLVAPYDPYEQNLLESLVAPTSAHWFGTDQYGRDVLSRVIWGTRISFAVGTIAVALGAVVGTAIGLISGYYRGNVDAIIMRGIDIGLVFPIYLLAILVISILGTSLLNLILAIGISSAPNFARLVRGQALGLMERTYVEAARSLGASGVRVMSQHLLPNLLAPILVMATLRIGLAIVVEASLSFLGLGPAPPTASWGLMVSDGRQFLVQAPWVSALPGVAIMAMVLCFNILGDGLRDVLDPALRGGRKVREIEAA